MNSWLSKFKLMIGSNCPSRHSEPNQISVCQVTKCTAKSLSPVDTKEKHHFILQRHAPPCGLISVVKDSSCRGIMSPNTLQNFDTNIEVFLDCPPLSPDFTQSASN